MENYNPSPLFAVRDVTVEVADVGGTYPEYVFGFSDGSHTLYVHVADIARVATLMMQFAGGIKIASTIVELAYGRLEITAIQSCATNGQVTFHCDVSDDVWVVPTEQLADLALAVKLAEIAVSCFDAYLHHQLESASKPELRLLGSCPFCEASRQEG